MRDRNSLRYTARRRAVGWIVALLVPASVPVLASPQEASADGVSVRSVSAAAQPCLNVRSRPSYRAPLIDCLESGSVVTVTMTRDGWSYVATGAETNGWVGSRFLVDGAGESGAAAAPTPEASPEYPSRELELISQAARERDRMSAELAAARDAWDAAAAEAAALGARVQELTEERDSLTRQLARAEARALYLLSDLEKTRAELARLKGIPPKLVQPEPEPEPAPVEPLSEPEAEPEPDAESEAFALPVDPNFMLLDEAVATIRAWAAAWSDQRVHDYLSFYAPSFVPASGERRDAWVANRRQRIAAPRSIEIGLDGIDPSVSGERATVRFVQTYTSDTFSDQVTKTLVLERSASGGWWIVEERAE